LKLKNYHILLFTILLLVIIFDFIPRFSKEVYNQLKKDNYSFNFSNIIPLTKEIESSMELKPYLVFQGKRIDNSNLKNQTKSRKRYYNSDLINKDATNVLFLGGSVVENMSINLDSLEKKLKNTGFDFEFINGGWSAYNVIQEFILLSQVINEYQPDFVLLFDGFNDVWLSIFDGLKPGIPQHFETITKINKYVDSPYLSVLNDITDRIYLVRYLKYKIRRNTNKIIFKHSNNYLPNEISKSYNRYVKNIAALCNYNNIQLIVVHQPSIFTKEFLSSDEEKWLANNENVLRLKQEYLDTWNILKKETRSLASNNKFKYYDLSTMFNHTKETVFFDVVHFQKINKGLEIADKLLLKELESILIDKNQY
tara:strand:+ start:77 stop:1177 length:1101 start_codon:yes stop_codon:yes gene_type:complete